MSEEKTCLVVDDSSVVRKVLSKIITELGFKTSQAENGAAALEACRESLPTVVLLDWNMPIMSGMEFFENFLEIEDHDDTKVIFCTTENELDKISEAIAKGADEYIMKPFDKDILEEKFRQVGLIED